ncbi:iron-containing alcohol dehydrogenase [Rhodococcus sp. MSC1_016]|jgi:maleylacetate reductase|uniref:iron-containing alcohol dehydrogenase n=1 Tax=Rhodococcus sp. MSC1_016 TaxID=2909266 RepID=UPI00202F47EA|nr:iron-containing alcohol dehydrogenase [Rhodococcus sp. MSC1_016]
MSSASDPETARRLYFPELETGQGQTLHLPAGAAEIKLNADARRVVPQLLEDYGYERAFIFSSRTLNQKTDVIDRLAAALGPRLVGRSDRVGEHAPVKNVLSAIQEVEGSDADVMVTVGGGSVMDFGKFVQLGVTEGVRTHDDLRALRIDQEPKLNQRPTLRQIAIPTTFSLSEWTAAGTPVDDETGKKIILRIPDGVGRAIVYDPSIVAHTPRHLALVTAVRGLDHAVNSVLSTRPNDLCIDLCLQAIRQFAAGIPLLARGDVETAIPLLQRASFLAGMCQLSVPHGFSHFMVHVFAPWAHVGHSETACVMMLAQARWLRGHGDPRIEQVTAAMGRPGDPLDVIVRDLLEVCDLPTTVRELGVDPQRLDDVVPLALAHPYVTYHNLRPIRTAEDISTILASVAG